MPKTIDEKEILKRNPHIKKSQLDDSVALTQQLIENGIQVSRYNLASPFSKTRIKKLKGAYAHSKYTGSFRRT